MTRSSAIMLALTATVSACGGGWRRLDDLAPRALQTRAQVQVWQADGATLLHGVALESDSLSGVPFTQPPTCDSCAVRIALETVDSLRVGSRERGFFRSVGLELAVGSVRGYLVRDVGGN